ncbi:MAG: glycosyltransferase family 8 protein [Devosia sp.]
MPGQPLHIALTFDDNFGAPAYATARGICLATRRRADLVFHLCHPALSSETIELLDTITTEFGATLIHHDIDRDADYLHFSQSLPHTRFISAVMYARLLLDRIVDPSIARIAYIDCDILVRAPIEGLLDEDLAGRPLGAVRDPHAMVSSNRRDVRQDRDLFDPADPYFNSGVLVIDLAAWRQMNIVGALLSLEQQGILARLPNDQQILNYLFKHNWTEINPSWNTFAAGTAIEIFNPSAVHYTGLAKPWNFINLLPFRRIYRHVMTNEVFYRYMRQRWAREWKARLGLGRQKAPKPARPVAP